MNTHECQVCHVVKSLTDFYSRPTKRGYQTRCKACVADQTRAWRVANPEGRRQQRKRERSANGDVLRARSLDWYEANRDAAQASNRRWMRENPERVRAARQRWAAANPGRRLEAFRAWCAAHPEDMANYAATRRALELGAPNRDLSPLDWAELLNQYGHQCAYCGRDGALARDHKVPLSRGGSHTKTNIVPACKPCNSRKGTKTVPEFAAWLSRSAA